MVDDTATIKPRTGVEANETTADLSQRQRATLLRVYALLLSFAREDAARLEPVQSHGTDSRATMGCTANKQHGQR